MARTKTELTGLNNFPNLLPVISPERSIPIEGLRFALSVEDGPIVREGCSHAFYADLESRTILVDGHLTSSERMWAACLAVASAADHLHARHLLNPPLAVD